MSEEEELFFVTRNGAVWACWLGGRPSAKLGDEKEVLATMAQFIAECAGEGSAPAGPPQAAPAPPIATHFAAPLPEPSAQPPPAERERHAERHEISIIGRVFRTGTGARDVTVLDLSEQGCRFHDRFGNLPKGTPLTIKLGPVGPVEATVMWSRGEYVGVQFRSPLYPSVLEHIRQHFDLRR
jgi:hypothetical protein